MTAKKGSNRSNPKLPPPPPPRPKPASGPAKQINDALGAKIVPRRPVWMPPTIKGA